jgi:dTDP-4-amino-4,6-dideoxygalactose transaminase
MDEIMWVAKEQGLFVVEDCAQAFGARYKEKKVGSFGDTGCFSFFPSKNLGAFGDAGAITTDDEDLASIIKMLRVHGGKDKYNVDHIGYKARLDTIQAAVLLAKLQYIDEFNERRKKIAEIYNKELSDSSGVMLPITHYASRLTNVYHVYHQYTIRVTNGKRDALQRHLKENGIDSMVYYPVPLHKMNVFVNNGMEIFGSPEKSEVAAQSVLSLPIEPLLKKERLKRSVNY